MLIKIFIYRFYITILSRKYLTKEAPNHSSNIILTGKDVLPEKDLLEKAKTIKWFEYLPQGSELKKQTAIDNIK